MKVYQYDLEGNFIKEWDSPKQAATDLNIIYTCVYKGCKTNYRVGKWQFKTFKKDKILIYIYLDHSIIKSKRLLALLSSYPF